MKSVFFCFFSLAVAGLQAQPQPVSLSAPIRSVTVFADRALIRRSATLELKPGVAQYQLKGLPAWLDVRALYSLQKPIMLIPCGPNAGPTGGAGVALPA